MATRKVTILVDGAPPWRGEIPATWTNKQAKAYVEDQYRKHPPQAPAPVGEFAAPPDGSELNTRNAARSFAQGGTLGFQDELQAGLGTVMDVLGGNIKPGEMGDQYRFLRDQERADQERFANANPKTNFALQVAGGAPLAVSGGAPAGWGAAARMGAKFGAGAGLGASEADLTRPDLSSVGTAAFDTTVGAGLGAGLGAAAPWVIQQAGNAVGAAGRGASQLANRVAPNFMLQVRQQNQRDLTRMGVDTYLQRVRAATRLRRPPQVGPEHQRLNTRLEEMGFQVTPGVRTNDPQLRLMEASHRSNPLSPVGAAIWNSNRANARRLNSMSAARIGLFDQSGEMSPTMLGVARTELSRRFNSVRDRIPRFKFDQQSRLMMNRLMTEASDPVAPDKAVIAELRRLQGVDDFNGFVSGSRAMEIRKKWAEAAREAWLPGKNNNPAKARMYEGLVDMLDDRIERAVGPDLLPEWQDYRKMWRDLIVLDSPGVVTKNSVNVPALNQAMGRVYRSRYRNNLDIDPTTGRGDPWFDTVRGLANAGELVADSGTATRLSYMGEGAGFSPGLVGSLVASRVAAPVVGGAYMKGGHTLVDAPGILARGAGRAARPVVSPTLSEGKRYLDEEIK